MSRYPYTEAADFIRGRTWAWQEIGGALVKAPLISRAEASSAYGAVAEVLGIPKEELATKIADYARKETAEGRS